MASRVLACGRPSPTQQSENRCEAGCGEGSLAIMSTRPNDLPDRLMSAINDEQVHPSINKWDSPLGGARLRWGGAKGDRGEKPLPQRLQSIN